MNSAETSPAEKPYEPPREVSGATAETEIVSPQRSLDWFAVAACYMTLLSVIGIGDVLAMSFASGHLLFGTLFALAAYAVLLVPTVFSVRRQRREPDRWRGQGYLFVAITVLAIHGTMVVFSLASYFLR